MKSALDFQSVVGEVVAWAGAYLKGTLGGGSKSSGNSGGGGGENGLVQNLPR